MATTGSRARAVSAAPSRLHRPPHHRRRVYVLDRGLAAGAQRVSPASCTSAARPRARLPRPARPHRRALRARSVRAAPGARLYRTGDRVPLPRGRRARVPGPRRPAGEGARLPHRARRDRGRARRGSPASRPPWWSCARTRRAEAPGRPTCVVGATGAEARCRGAARAPARTSARLHGARRLRRARPLPLHANGKVDRAALPASGRARAAAERLRRAAQRPRSD